MELFVEGVEQDVCNFFWGGRKGFWGEKMFDFSFEEWINIKQEFQYWKDILRQR